MRRKRITYRPGKGQRVTGLIMSGIFVCIGIFVVIPNFGPFGLVWTGVTVVMLVNSVLQVLGKGHMNPEIEVEEEQPPAPPVQEYRQEASQAVSQEAAPAAGLSPQARLEQLKTLQEAGLITDEEYHAKRDEILHRL